MSWWDLFSWGYATDIEERDHPGEDLPEEEDINIDITITLGE